MTHSLIDGCSYILIGAAVSAFGTLIGAGGGIIFVPLFLFLFDWPPALVAGTSLAIVLCNALSGTAAYVRDRKIKYDAGVQFALATVPGAVAGAALASYFSGPLFRLSFGTLLVSIALLLFWKNLRTDAAVDESASRDFSYSVTGGILVSLAVGLISSIFGIGGGVIHVPAMVYLLGFPAHIATATSQFVLAVSAAVGVVSHSLANHVCWEYAAWFGIGALIGAQAGARLARRIRARRILLLLALALLALGVRLMIFA